jgi:hypothetical protein
MTCARVAATPITSYRAGMKVKGTIKRTDVEGGHWLLDADDGQQYQLVGKVDGATDGQRVEVEGKVDKNAMGIGMMGAHLSVQKLTAL